MLRTAGEEERESRASSSGVSPSSANALAGSEAEKKERGRMERARGRLGLGFSKTTRDGEVAHKQRAHEATQQRHPMLGWFCTIRFKTQFYPKNATEHQSLSHKR